MIQGGPPSARLRTTYFFVITRSSDWLTERRQRVLSFAGETTTITELFDSISAQMAQDDWRGLRPFTLKNSNVLAPRFRVPG